MKAVSYNVPVIRRMTEMELIHAGLFGTYARKRNRAERLQESVRAKTELESVRLCTRNVDYWLDKHEELMTLEKDHFIEPDPKRVDYLSAAVWRANIGKRHYGKQSCTRSLPTSRARLLYSTRLS